MNCLSKKGHIKQCLFDIPLLFPQTSNGHCPKNFIHNWLPLCPSNNIVKGNLIQICLIHFYRMLVTNLPPGYSNNVEKCRPRLAPINRTLSIYIMRTLEQTIHVGFQVNLHTTKWPIPNSSFKGQFEANALR